MLENRKGKTHPTFQKVCVCVVYVMLHILYIYIYTCMYVIDRPLGRPTVVNDKTTGKQVYIYM